MAAVIATTEAPAIDTHGGAAAAIHNSTAVDQEELSVSFRYLLNRAVTEEADSDASEEEETGESAQTAVAFGDIWVAGLNANLTLADTDIGQGSVRDEIEDSPRAMRRRRRWANDGEDPALSVASYADLTSSEAEPVPLPFRRWRSDGNLSRQRRWRNNELSGGGAVGEDRIQVICDKDRSLLFCAIYDGFNGRDVADFLSATLFRCFSDRLDQLPEASNDDTAPVVSALGTALQECEAQFMKMVAAEAAGERQTMAMVGACVAVVVVLGRRLYYMNLGDSRVVLASEESNGALLCEQLTEEHAATNSVERRRILAQHSREEEGSLLYRDRVKGKIRVTRAIGAAFLKQKEFNDILLPAFKVNEMLTPPYISIDPHIGHRCIQIEDRFVVMASDGLFDILTNDEVVSYVDVCLHNNLHIGPAHYLLSRFRLKVAMQADMTVDTLRNLRYGTRRTYHDDVSIIVICLV